MGAFHAYDIRGIYNLDFDKNDVYKIGFFIPGLLKTDKVLVGRDVRLSSPEIYEYLTKGITDAGADVFDAGLATTPMIYWLTAQHNFDASVMITASHNGKEYNGLKVSRANAMPVAYDSGLSIIENWMKTRDVVPAEKKGRIVEFDKRGEYLGFLAQYKPAGLEDLNISIDCSNGMAALLIKDLLGDVPHYIFDELDGSFPNHEANPLIPENTVAIRQEVVKNSSDLGIIFDGDADRVMFIDEKGKFISPDLMIALMGHYFLKDNENVTVIQDIRTSKAVGEYLNRIKPVDVYTWRVGRAFAAPKLKEINGLFGGELAGHYYFRDFNYSDSGIMAMLIILNVIIGMKQKGKTLSGLIDDIKAYSNSGEINFRIEDKKGAMEAVREHFSAVEKPVKFMDFDGYRLEYPDWWFNIRPSNTEPYLRLIVEARTDELLGSKVAEIKEIIARFE
jgi:phosphomannomutase